jgi:WS/DGAT/MGAT family acyltransferase
MALAQTPDYEALSAQDSSFVWFEHRPTHMHVAALAIVERGPLRTPDGGIDAPRLARYVESRLGALPHYRQKLAFAPVSGRAVWVDDEHFDLAYHVRHTALPQPRRAEELKQLVGRVLSQPLDRDRPLWELWIIEGLAHDRFALLMKVHHCMVDGVAGVSLLSLLMRSEPDDSIADTEAWFPRPQPSPLRLGLDELASRAQMPLALARELWSAVREPQRALRSVRARTAAVGDALRAGLRLPSATALNLPIGPHRRVEWMELDLAEIKALRRKLGGTLNDVVLTIVAGATGRFLARRHESLARLDYRVVVPVNMRAPDGEPALSNRVSAFFLSLPVHERDPLARFEAVRAETARAKSSHAAEGIDFFTQMVERSGSTWLNALGVRLAARVQPYNQIVSNVPGPQEPLYVLGARLEALYPLPPLFERQGLGTAVLSYDGKLCWGLVADRDSVPDLAALPRDVEAAYAELRDAAFGAPPRSRAAAEKRRTSSS